MVITEKGKARAKVIIGEMASSVEHHAAEELVKYIKEISGVYLTVFKDNESDIKKEKNLILIGRPETNKLVKELSDKGSIKLSVDFPGLDGFIIKSLSLNDKNCLVLGGSMDRGTLYAVYELLESCLGVGFFRDGDKVPKNPQIEVSGIDRAEKPAYGLRGFLEHPAWAHIYIRSPRLWTFEEWKKEFDWAVKRKFNSIVLFHTDFEVLSPMFRLAFPNFDAGYLQIDKIPVDFRVLLYDQLANYAKNLGLQIVHNFFPRVPESCKVIYPDAVYHEAALINYEGKHGVYDVCPSKPEEFKKCVKQLWKAQMDIFGKDSHTYMVFPPFWEIPPCEHIESRAEGFTSIYQVLKELDPEAQVFAIAGWTMDDKYWDYFKEGKIPADVKICDCDSPVANPDLWEKTNYWQGRDWLFWTHASMEFADLPYTWPGCLPNLLIDRARLALEHGAIGYILFDIAANSNVLPCNLMAQLAWDPQSVDLDKYLTEYCDLRYGQESTKPMLECHRRFIKISEVLNPKGILTNQRLGVIPSDEEIADFHSFLPGCLKGIEKVLELAKEEMEHQLSNRLYQNDLFELRLIYLWLKWMTTLVETLHNKDYAKAKNSRELLALVVEHLRSNPEYSIKQTWEKMKREIPQVKYIPPAWPGCYMHYEFAKLRLKEFEAALEKLGK